MPGDSIIEVPSSFALLICANSARSGGPSAGPIADRRAWASELIAADPEDVGVSHSFSCHVEGRDIRGTSACTASESPRCFGISQAPMSGGCLVPRHDKECGAANATVAGRSQDPAIGRPAALTPRSVMEIAGRPFWSCGGLRRFPYRAELHVEPGRLPAYKKAARRAALQTRPAGDLAWKADVSAVPHLTPLSGERELV
jgi:hypothetical protein